MKIAYRPIAVDLAPGDEPENFIAENRYGMTLRCSKSRALRLGFTEEDLAAAVTLWPNDGFIACPRQTKSDDDDSRPTFADGACGYSSRDGDKAFGDSQ